jgi:hypothetical protein
MSFLANSALLIVMCCCVLLLLRVLVVLCASGILGDQVCPVVNAAWMIDGKSILMCGSSEDI